MNIILSPYRILFYLLFLFPSLLFGQTTSPKHEVRAVWLTTLKNLDWPQTRAVSEYSMQQQKQELCDILDQLKTAGINMVMLQTRVRATTIYPSIYEPWDACLTGTFAKSPGYDPLHFAIDECHKRGMELHAWVVTIPIGKWNVAGSKQLRQRHPSMVKRVKDEGYMNPENKETAGYIAKICREITENYDVDGIHLDYIRYPETWPLTINRPEARRNITNIVKEIHANVKAAKPWVKLSCAPIGKYNDLSRYKSYGWNAYHKVCQDPQLWLKEGWMDMLFPMMYFDGKHFYPFVMDWKENDYGRIVAAGLGTYMLSSEERDWDISAIQRQIAVLRGAGMGYAHFRSKFFTEDTKGIYTLTTDHLNATPSLIPPTTWLSSVIPLPPDTFSVHRYVAGDELSWSEGFNASGDSYLLYNVYASPVYPVDTDNPANIIASRLTKRAVSIPQKSVSHSLNNGENTPLYYAVTAVDRYGNESLPVFSPLPEERNYFSSTIPNDGQDLFIPTDHTAFDASYAAIETLQGNIVAVLPYRSGHVNISSLPDGFYQIKSLGRKGVTHRLGYFTVKRHTNQKP